MNAQKRGRTNTELSEVVQDYFRNQNNHRRPTIRSVVEALKVCKKYKDVETGRRIHKHQTENGDCSNIVVATALLDMYAECGSLANADQIIQSIQTPDVFAWTAIISAYAKLQRGALAFRSYRMMLDAGCLPDRVTILAALKACTSLAEQEEGIKSQFNNGEVFQIKTRSLEKGRFVHAQAVSFGEEQDLFVASSLVDMYSKCGSMAEARRVFEGMEIRNEVSWNSMILGYVQGGESQLALEFFSRMQNEGCRLSSITVVAALKACASLAEKAEGIEGEVMRLKALEKGEAIHGQAVHNQLVLGVQAVTSLIDLYTKCGCLGKALRIFQGIQQQRRDVTLWSCIILGCVQNGESKLALELFAEMQQQQRRPDSTTFVGVLKAFSSLALEDCSSKAEFLEKGRAIHSEAAKRGMINSFVTNSLTDMYAKCGDLLEARKLFDQSSEFRDVVSWNCMIQSYAQGGKADLALDLYRRMQKEGCTPDALTFVASLKACSSLAAIETGRWIHSDIRRAGLERDAFVANSLVDLYGKCGSMEDAEKVFCSIDGKRKNLVTWSALISGYSLQGDVQRVIELLQEMKRARIQPDDVTALSVLAACSHAGMVEEGKKFFEKMRSEFGLVPRAEHYSCMVDLLGRSNRLEEAVLLVESMTCRCEGDSHAGVLWMALLGGSWKWKNVEVGEAAFRALVRLDRRDASAYILMSNLYAATGMSKKARVIQAMMKSNKSRS